MKKLIFLFFILFLGITSFAKDTLIIIRQITGTNQHYAEVLFKTPYKGEEKISMAGIMSPDRRPFPNNIVYVGKANWDSAQKGYLCILVLSCLPDTKYFWSVRLYGVVDTEIFFEFKTKECFAPVMENIESEETSDSFRVSFTIPYNPYFSGTYFFVRVIIEDPETKKFGVFTGDLYKAIICNGFDTTIMVKNPRKILEKKDVPLLLTAEISNGCTIGNVTQTLMMRPKGEGMKVFPNPTRGIFSVSGIEKGSVIKIFSIDGKLLTQSLSTTTQQVFDISKFPTGVYILTDGKASKKIIKL